MSDMFFGRERETEVLKAVVSSRQRLTVLYAASGAGKTSLLRAGIIPALIRARLLPNGTPYTGADAPERPLPLLVRDWGSYDATLPFAERLTRCLSLATKDYLDYLRYLQRVFPGALAAIQGEHKRVKKWFDDTEWDPESSTSRADAAGATVSDLARQLGEAAKSLGSIALILDQFEEPLKSDWADGLDFVRTAYSAGGLRLPILISMRKDKEHLIKPLKSEGLLVGGQQSFTLEPLSNDAARSVMEQLSTKWGFNTAAVADDIFQLIEAQVSPSGTGAPATMLGLGACLRDLYELALPRSSAEGLIDCEVVVTPNLFDWYRSELHKTASDSSKPSVLFDWVSNSSEYSSVSAEGMKLYVQPNAIGAGYRVVREMLETDGLTTLIEDASRHPFVVDPDPPHHDIALYHAVNIDRPDDEDAGPRWPARVSFDVGKSNQLELGSSDDDAVVRRVIASIAERFGVGHDEKRPVPIGEIHRHAFNDALGKFANRLPGELTKKQQEDASSRAAEWTLTALRRLQRRNVIRQSGNTWELTHDQLYPPLREWAEGYRARAAYYFDWPLPLFGEHIFVPKSYAETGRTIDAVEEGRTWRWCRIENLVFSGTEFDGWDLRESVFANCEFHNVTFKNCKLHSVWWIQGCEFDNVIFEDSDMPTAGFEAPAMMHTVTIKGVERRSNCQGLEVQWGASKGTAQGIEFQGVDMYNSELNLVNLIGNLTFSNCDVSGSSIVRMHVKGRSHIVFEHQTMLNGFVFDRLITDACEDGEPALKIDDCDMKGSVFLGCSLTSMLLQNCKAQSLVFKGSEDEGGRESTEIDTTECAEGVTFLGTDVSGSVFEAVRLVGPCHFGPSELASTRMHRMAFEQDFDCANGDLVIDPSCSVELWETRSSEIEQRLSSYLGSHDRQKVWVLKG